MKFNLIDLPHINVNDTTATITKINFKNGDKVRENQEIMEVESTKTSVSIESKNNGYIYYTRSVNDEIATGEVIAIISEIQDEKILEKFEQKKESNIKTLITKKAQKLINENKINLNDLKNYKTISENTIINYLKSKDLNNNFSSSIKIDFNKNYSETDIILIGDFNSILVAKDIFDLNNQDILYYYSNKKDDKEIDINYISEQDLKKITDKKISVFICDDEQNNYLEFINFFTEKKTKLINCIHPSSIISKNANIGNGNLILAKTVIGPKVQIGNFCKILTGTTIAHHSLLKNNVTLSDGCIIGGNVKIFENSYLGLGVKVNKRVKIGKSCKIISGKTVIDNLQDGEILK